MMILISSLSDRCERPFSRLVLLWELTQCNSTNCECIAMFPGIKLHVSKVVDIVYIKISYKVSCKRPVKSCLTNSTVKVMHRIAPLDH